MLYETDAVADVRRPGVREDDGEDRGKRQYSGLRISQPPVPVAITTVAEAAAADPLQQTVVVVRPTAAYVEHTFAAGLTAFREYNMRFYYLLQFGYEYLCKILNFKKSS